MLTRSRDYPFYVVMEQTSPDKSEVEIIDEAKQGGELRYLRYRQCMQSFGHRNRNKRLWQVSHLQQMVQHPWLQQQFSKGGIPGESGHPMTATGQLSMERLCNIDPERVCFYWKDYEFKGNKLYGTCETADDGNGPGNRFMRSILQGIEPAVSCRSLVPQKKNADGSTDVTGPGRLICYDRVYYPSHEEAFRDMSQTMRFVTKGINKAIQPVYECAIKDMDFTGWAFEKSDKAKFILDDMNPVMESMCIDISGMLGVSTDEGNIFIPIHDERNIMKGIKDFMRKA